MSDDQHLELLKRRRLQEMRRRLLLNKTVELEEKSGEAEDPRQVLRKAFVGRGLEVWEAAEQQYPMVTRRITPALLSLIKAGKLRERITGEQLYWLFSRLGLRIRLNTKIRISEKGELKTIADKLRES
jgi:DNA-binding TFAR19-related protein (PDSD5 family)